MSPAKQPPKWGWWTDITDPDNRRRLRPASRREWHGMATGDGPRRVRRRLYTVDEGPGFRGYFRPVVDGEWVDPITQVRETIMADSWSYAWAVVHELGVDEAELRATAERIANADSQVGRYLHPTRDAQKLILAGVHELAMRPDVHARITDMGYSPWWWAWEMYRQETELRTPLGESEGHSMLARITQAVNEEMATT